MQAGDRASFGHSGHHVNPTLPLSWFQPGCSPVTEAGCFLVVLASPLVQIQPQGQLDHLHGSTSGTDIAVQEVDTGSLPLLPGMGSADKHPANGGGGFLSKAFSISIEIICFFSFVLLLWCIIVIDFQMLNQECISGLNSTWS